MRVLPQSFTDHAFVLGVGDDGGGETSLVDSCKCIEKQANLKIFPYIKKKTKTNGVLKVIIAPLPLPFSSQQV